MKTTEKQGDTEIKVEKQRKIDSRTEKQGETKKETKGEIETQRKIDRRTEKQRKTHMMK